MSVDFFISYNWADQNWAEWIAWQLEAAGYTTVNQAWDFRPGSNFVLEMQRAAVEAERTLIVLSPDYLEARFPQPEWAAAFAADPTGKEGKLLPVRVRDCQPKGLLPQIIWIDLVGKAEKQARHDLLAGVRRDRAKPSKAPVFPGSPKPSFPGGEKASLSSEIYRCMAPAREPFVSRGEYRKVLDALLASGTGCGTTVGITTALHGAGGFGKTALAIEICYDSKVHERFPDGILWATMGEEINAAGRLARVRDLIRWWTEKEPPAFETVSAAGAHLLRKLISKRVLLVVDDVWRPEDVTPFHGFGPEAALLITTRDSRTLPLESVPINVDAMEIPEAVQVLGAGLPPFVGVDLPGLARRLGEWPLLLKIVNRQLRELVQQDGLSPELACEEVEEALDLEGLTAFDREDAESRQEAVSRTVGASLRRLSLDEAERFEKLAIFPEDKDIPLRVLEKLWEFSSFTTKKLCARLHDLSLLLRFDRPAGTIRLHDVIRAYLLKQGESHLPEWNRLLLEAYCPTNGRWSYLPVSESYLWNHLFHHLIGAGQSDVCRDLLLDAQFLQSKLEATDINALLTDYALLVETDRELRLVRDALRLSAHILEKNSAELPGQLWGRLRERSEVKLQNFLRMYEATGASWLRPRTASLAQAGGALIRTIDHPGRPEALAVLPDRRVISGSSDGCFRIWDLESGQTLRIVDGYSHISAISILDSCQVVAGSFDGKLRLWDMESWQPLQVFEGHSDLVLAVGVLDSRRINIAGVGLGEWPHSSSP